MEYDKFLTFLGGEHSVSIGVIDAFKDKYPNLTVLQLDAHADLRKEYLGSEYNHACALHKASKTTNLLQVGIRSMDSCEKKYMDYNKCFFAEDMYGNTDWVDKSIELMTDDVYITIDLDAFDPSIMPSTGTPEPGGMDWNSTIKYLRKVFEPQFLVAKLYYKLLSYKYYGKK